MIAAKYLLQEHDPEQEKRKKTSRNPLVRAQLLFERKFEQLRVGYHGLLQLAIEHSAVFLILFVVFTIGSFALLYPWLGQDFFPPWIFRRPIQNPRTRADREPASRIQPVFCDEVDNAIRREIPKNEVVTVIDNIGIPYSGLNLSYTSTGIVGPSDADITVSLTPKHHPTDGYVQDLRAQLPREFPGVTFYTVPVDMVTQILNFGLPAPIDIQTIGPNVMANRAFADKLLAELSYVPGTADLRIQQPFNNPRLFIDVDRSKAQDVGLTQRDVAASLLVATSGSFQTSPTYWLDPKNGVSYSIAVQSPQYTLQSLADLEEIPLTPGSSIGSSAGTPALSAPASIGLGRERHRRRPWAQSPSRFWRT